MHSCVQSGCEHVELISAHPHSILLSELKQGDEIRGSQRNKSIYVLHLALRRTP